ncbi:MAG: discoidin domain-containing protein, partial [Muribaculaceae bacterium]|nr:discoidin domain-containing protein [Muribaculaceae bacterium]
MKKQFFWVLTLVLLALFPYQSAKADLVALNRTNWSAKADNYSNSGNDGPASYAINNNTGNWWHSFYSNSNGGGSTTQTLPHYIQFDLGSVQTFSAFNYVSRNGKTDGEGNGNIANYQLYVSDSDMTTSLGAGYVPTNGTLVKNDSFTYNGGSSAQDHIVDLGAEYSGQYVLLLATSSANGANWAACAEFYLYYDYDYCVPTVSTQGGTSNYVGQIVTLTTTGAKQDASWTNPVTSNLNGSTSIIENTFTAVPGQTLTLNITDKNTVWGCVRVYVDFNGNKAFDSGEQIFADASRNRTTPISQQFTLSSDIKPGSYLMRVMYVDADATTLTKWACDSYTQGGYYDFRFNVEEGVVVARTVSVSTIPAEGGTVTMNGSAVSSLEASGSITLVATPNSGYKFIGWYEGETLLSQATTYSDNSEEDKEYIAKFEQSYPIMTYIYTNSIQQSNRYLKEVVATQGANVTTVFSATTEGELPRIDPTAASTALTEAQGALVDKTATPIIIDQGATEFTINFKAWTNNMTIGGTSKASELQWTQQALFIDWNKDYDFLDTNENYGKSSNTIGNDGGVCASFISAGGYTRTVTVPAGIQPGTYRMRVCYYEPTDNSDAWNETLFTTLNNQTRNGKSYDFAIQVKEVIPRTITVEASPVEGGVVKANGTVGGVTNATGVVTITAEANAGYRFVNWINKETSEVVSSDETFTNSQDGNVT